MDTKDLIFEFVEGNTTPEQESILFSEISTNPELQELLKHAVAVDSAINENQDYFSPSVETTNSVFATLGMDLPGNANTSLTLSEKMNRFFESNQERFKNGLILLLLLSSTLLLLYDLSWKPEGFSKKESIALKRIPITTSIEVPRNDISNNTLITDNSEKSTTNNNSTNGTKQSSEKAIVKQEYNSLFNSLSNSSRNSETEDLTVKSKGILINNTEILSNSISIKHGEQFDGNYTNFEIEDILPEELKNKFSIELRQTPSWATQSAEIMPSELNTFNNTDIRLYYNLFSTFDIGLGIRQETFDQVFSGIANDGRDVTYFQKPNFTSFTANARYIYDSDLMLDPYMEASFGFNRGGIVSRAGTGFNIGLFKDLNLMIGVEFSNLNYNFQNSIYNTSNFGINYGVRYKF